MKLEASLKPFNPQGMHISDDVKSTSPNRLNGTDVMTGIGVTSSRARFGLAAFFGKAGISKTDEQLTGRGRQTPAVAAAGLARYWTARRQKSRECRYIKPVSAVREMVSPASSQRTHTGRSRCTYLTYISPHGHATGSRFMKGWWIRSTKERDRPRLNLRRRPVINVIETDGGKFLHDRVDFA